MHSEDVRNYDPVCLQSRTPLLDSCMNLKVQSDKFHLNSWSKHFHTLLVRVLTGHGHERRYRNISQPSYDAFTISSDC